MLMTCGIKYAAVSHQEVEPQQPAAEPATNNLSLGQAETRGAALKMRVTENVVLLYL